MKAESAERSPERSRIIDKINEYESKGWFDRDVEDDPESKELFPEEIDYLKKSIGEKVKTKLAFMAAKRFLNGMIKKRQFIVKEIVGAENLKSLNCGAVITCNHFSPMDSFAMQLAFDAAGLKKRRMYRVIREGNYTSFGGFYGFLMRHCYTLPLSSNTATMKKFLTATEQILNRGDFVLIYPEQSMWWNYKKPKPLKNGAYKIAARGDYPILPVFITMEDSDIIGGDGFPVQQYTIHIEKAIFPDLDKTKAQNAENLKNRNFEIWKNIYEKTYNVPLKY